MDFTNLPQKVRENGKMAVERIIAENLAAKAARQQESVAGTPNTIDRLVEQRRLAPRTWRYQNSNINGGGL